MKTFSEYADPRNTYGSDDAQDKPTAREVMVYTIQQLPPIPDQFIDCTTSMDDLMDAMDFVDNLTPFDNKYNLSTIQILMLLDYRKWLGELISFWLREMD